MGRVPHEEEGFPPLGARLRHHPIPGERFGSTGPLSPVARPSKAAGEAGDYGEGLAKREEPSGTPEAPRDRICDCAPVRRLIGWQ